MSTPTILSRCLAFVLAALLAGATGAWAQEGSKDKDDALDALLKKLDENKPSADQPAEKAKDEAKAKSDDKKSSEKQKDAKAEGGSPAKPRGEVAPKDKALDGLLEKLGKTEETPAPEERRPSAGGADKPPMPGEPKPGEPKPGERKPGQPPKEELQGKAKDLDEHLEELTGRKRKKKGQDEEDEGSGQLGKIIKEMREVEERLGKPDTGEDTRKKQEEIVKNIDQIIEQIKNSPGGQGRLVMRKVRGQGQPGGQQGGPGAQAQGNNAQGTGAMKPAKPPSKSVVANDKDVWGNLPPILRDVMDNVAKEAPLPDRAELIKRYYLSLSKKGKSQPE